LSGGARGRSVLGKEDETMPFLQRIFADLFGLLTFQHSGVPHWHDQNDEAYFRTLDPAELPGIEGRSLPKK
jgi:hypothetical protein